MLFRSLAYATRSFAGNPGDTYWVLGSVLSANRRMQQVLTQLAAAHLTNRDLARTDDGDAQAGRTHAQDAAMALRRAVFLLERVDDQLSEASQQSGRIAWDPGPLNSGRPAGLEVDVDDVSESLATGGHRDAGGPDLSA